MQIFTPCGVLVVVWCVVWWRPSGRRQGAHACARRGRISGDRRSRPRPPVAHCTALRKAAHAERAAASTGEECERKPPMRAGCSDRAHVSTIR